MSNRKIGLRDLIALNEVPTSARSSVQYEPHGYYRPIINRTQNT